MIDQGVAPTRLHLIPGFVEERNTTFIAAPAVPCFVFVGRASSEKGLAELLEIWPQEYRLDIIGSGEFGNRNPADFSNVRFLGIRDRDWILKILPSYTALIFPGRVWEGAYPLVVREALEAGVPVVALSGSSAADLVAEEGVGAVYADEDSDNLWLALNNVISAGNDLRAAARALFEHALTEAQWSERIQSIYRTVCDV